jgi:hypothetical protein
VDQARGRGHRRHDGSHRVRRDPVRRKTDPRGSRKRAPQSFLPPAVSPCTSLSWAPLPEGVSPSGTAGARPVGWRARIPGERCREASRQPL